MIYVDRMRACVPNAQWRWDESCHLYTLPGNADELHAFAARVGLRRGWFQNASRMPHYDLTKARRVKAVKLGAVEVDDRTMVGHMDQWALAGWSACTTDIAVTVRRLIGRVPSKKYLLVPGRVASRNDGDIHFVNERDLARLYCVRLEECVIANEPTHPRIFEQLCKELTVLRPRYDGDYPIFKTPEGRRADGELSNPNQPK